MTSTRGKPNDGVVSTVLFWLACIEIIAVQICVFYDEFVAFDCYSNINSTKIGVYFSSIVSVFAFSVGILDGWIQFFRGDEPAEEILSASLMIHLAVAIFGVLFLSLP
ncbi:hypothetical protein [Burkholderia sp. MSMB1078WGS]|uniref:hypothetical protein n=1 Tax=Burkholderia sp. MSMB1078WGS TaxID=1637900 RepID=UPI0012E3514A|nr:hypothetical protein [Burkholderia sp. MSMB1078WGS]